MYDFRGGDAELLRFKFMKGKAGLCEKVNRMVKYLKELTVLTLMGEEV